jgi:hypothetical protein
MVVSKLKYGKATGHDQIPAKLIKEGGEELKNVIYKLITKYSWKSSYHLSVNMA